MPTASSMGRPGGILRVPPNLTMHDLLFAEQMGVYSFAEEALKNKGVLTN